MMYHLERMLSMVRREVTRTISKLHKPPRVGLVSSYNKKLHAVKVKFQPEGTESGWIPLTSMAVGNGFGILSAPNVNDQVEVEFQEGSMGVARVRLRHFSSVDNPPQIDPGEHALIHQSGSTIYHKKDGTLLIAGPGYTKTGQTGGGQSGNLGTGGQSGETGQSAQQQQQQQPQGLQTIKLAPDGTLTIDVPKNNLVLHCDSNTIYIISPPKQTHCVSSMGAPVIPVALIDGSAAKTLMAEPDA